MIVIADGDDWISKAIGGIKDAVGGLWDGKKPLASVLSFLGPGLLYLLPGSSMLILAYELAGAVGFDWIGFWDSLIKEVANLFENTKNDKLTKDEVQSKATNITEQLLDSHVDENKVDDKKVEELSKKMGGQIQVNSDELFNLKIIKNSGILGSLVTKSRGIVRAIFSKVIPWLITTAAISLGFTAATGAAKGVLGLTKEKEPEVSSERDFIRSIPQSSTMSKEMTEFNNNGPGSVWIENGNVNSIKSYLTNWILNVYPQFKSEISQIENSPIFIQVENMFFTRNKMAEQLQIYSVPKPFEKKIDVVTYIISGYLKAKGK